MAFRVAFFFQVQQERLGGWSQNFWNSSSDLAPVISAATALRAAMFNFMGAPVQAPNIRISDVDRFREVTIQNFPAFTYGDSPAAGYVDYVNTSALLKMTADPSYITRQWMKGIPDADVDLGGRWDPRAASLRRLNAVFSLLTSASQGWALRKLDRAILKRTITGITAAGVVSCANHGLATDDKTRISRVVSPTSLNRIFKVVRIDNDSFSLVGPPAMSAPAQVGISTTSRKQATSYIAIKAVTVDRVTSHRTGRPFGQLSGRRRIRR
jgi:hypothetical protein